MQVFKFLILIIILILSSFIGILISKRYSNRVTELQQIKNALNMLKTKIKFTYEPLPDIFKQIAKTMPENLASIFENTSQNMKMVSVKDAWNNAIDEAMLSINKEDKNVLKELGKLLRTNRCRWTS